MSSCHNIEYFNKFVIVSNKESPIFKFYLINFEWYIYLHVVFKYANINKVQIQNEGYYLFRNIKFLYIATI